MEKATISQLKNSLSAYLKKVRAGHSVLILDRDEPIAVLERINAKGHSGGGAYPASNRRGSFDDHAPYVHARCSRRLPLPNAERSVVDALLDERREAP